MKTMELLRTKHPEGKEAIEDALLPGEIPMVQPIIFESIDEDVVLKAAQMTKGGSGPSGMDADGWRKLSEDSSETIRVMNKSKELHQVMTKEYSFANTLSMGTTSDYMHAIDCGSSMIRIGELIFGKRQL